ncbi:contractile injection system tape measure protein [Photorhabdus sp. APURE]|uniref:contractile injection system tape measure protein n=1 Tax=Photorhabdus aballayi TaxID=2991723 RepID=UPI00223CF7A4|nr:contractile injection system tape measure protein [Photorhabdus aballayi]MCW7546523.1 contractile injection system tape measure protein [Photorhabdus aballayi]
MISRPNLLSRLSITIETNNQQIAKKVLYDSLLNQVSVHKLLNLYFNKYVISQDIYLDKLTLNLGEINSHNFNVLFPIRLNAALNKALNQYQENNKEKILTGNSIISKNTDKSSLLHSHYLSDIEEFIQYLYQKDIKLNSENIIIENNRIDINIKSLINQLMQMESNLTLLLAKSCLSEHSLQSLLAISQPDLLTAINHKLSEDIDGYQHQGKAASPWQLVLNALGYIQRHNTQEIPKPDMKVISYIMAELDSSMLDIVLIITLFRKNIVAENDLLNAWLKLIWQIELIPKLCKKHLSVQEYKSLANRFGGEIQTFREQSLQQTVSVNSMIIELLQKLSTEHRQDLPPLSQHQLSLIITAIQKGEIKTENILQLLQHPALYNQTGTAWLAPLWQLGSISQRCKKHLSIDQYNKLSQRFMTNNLTPDNLHVKDNNCSQLSDINRPHFESGLSSPYQVSNAGILILWPMLPTLFNQLGLLEEKEFIHHQAQFRAVDFLDYLIWGNEEGQVERKTLNKVLCGLMIDEETQLIPVEPEEQRIIEQWLDAIIVQLPGWKKLSCNDVRQLFLQRPGELLIDEQEIKITLQHQPFDLLLADWPWPLNIVKLPWLNRPLQVDWQNI